MKHEMMNRLRKTSVWASKNISKASTYVQRSRWLSFHVMITALFPSMKRGVIPYLPSRIFHFLEVYIAIVAPKRTVKVSLCLHLMARIRTQRHAIREKARKRTKNLFKKVNELAQIADANVYIIVNRGGKYQIYRSTDQPGWPPSEQEMVSQ